MNLKILVIFRRKKQLEYRKSEKRDKCLLGFRDNNSKIPKNLQ